MTSFEVPLPSRCGLYPQQKHPKLVSYGKTHTEKIKAKVAWGRAGIEPATSPTRRENHTSRPTARLVDDQDASNEDRTRDLVLTKHMLCQLSYRGDVTTLEYDTRFENNFKIK